MSPSPAATYDAAADAAAGRVRALGCALVATLLLAVCSWGAIHASTWRSAISAGRELRVQHLCGEITYLDEVLTMSAAMAAATGERRWRERYDAHVDLLDSALRELRAMSPSLFDRELGGETDLANQRLVALETRLFELVERGDRASAAAILDSESYLVDKRAYAAGNTRAQQALGDWVTADRESTRQLGTLFSIAATVLAAVAAFAWGAVRRRTQAIRVAAELATARAQSAAAAAAAQQKSLFVANISHELRTPLTAILGYAEVLVEDGQPAPATLAAAQTIQRQGEHLLQIVNDLLDMTKIEAGKVEVHAEPTDVVQLIEDVLSALRVRARSKGIRLECCYRTPLPRPLSTDPVRLRQILVNLIGNAVKFTSQGGVQVLVDYAATTPVPQLHLAVVDTGIGMRSDQLARLFQPFVQADASTERRFGGTGLGLAIARHYARLLGGDIAATSAAGRGSTFTVSLPVVGATGPNWQQAADGAAATTPNALPGSPAATAALGTTAATALSGVRILLAEDGADNQRLLSLLLQRAGVELTIADDGVQALGLLLGPTPPPFELVLLDMHMPHADGYQVAKRLRATGSNLPIVALTASAMPGDREQCLAAGCNDYLTKPIDRQQLLATCARWSGRQPPPAVGDPPLAAGGPAAVR
jgi:signal transduction histidine kinase/ActR/RegA family two-component response regulator